MIVLVLAIIFLAWILTSPLYWWRRGVPSTLPLPIFGNFLPLIYLNVQDFLEQLYNKIPDVPYVGVHLCTRPVLLLRDPQIIVEVLEEKASFFRARGLYSNPERELVANTLFFLAGENWKEVRSKMSPMLTSAKVKSIIQNGRQTFDRMLNDMDSKIIKDEEGKSFGHIDFLNQFMSHSIDLAANSFFGVESNIFKEGKSSEFYKTAKSINTPLAMTTVMVGMLSPKIYDMFNFSVLTKEVSAFVTSVMDASVNLRKGIEPSKKLVVDALIENFDEKDTRAQGMIMYLGAVETTAISLSFALYELAKNPTLQSELRSKIGTEEGQKLVKAVAQESLRKYPVFKLLNRTCTERCKLSTGLVIEPGTMCIVVVSAMHSDPKYFPNPEEFRPGREMPKGAYVPFGAGPMHCVGMKMALAVMEESLSLLLKRYEFFPGDVPMKLDGRTFLTMSKTGVWLKYKTIS